MGPTWAPWVLSAPDMPHVGPVKLAIRESIIHIFYWDIISLSYLYSMTILYKIWFCLLLCCSCGISWCWTRGSVHSYTCTLELLPWTIAKHKTQAKTLCIVFSWTTHPCCQQCEYQNQFKVTLRHNLLVKTKLSIGNPVIELTTSNGSWRMGTKGEMSGTVCVTFTWDMYIYIYIWVVYSLCFFCCLFITVTWWYVWCFEWASGNQEEVQACLVTLWLFIISCYSLYKTTLGLLCSWFENNPHFHKYSMDFHV